MFRLTEQVYQGLEGFMKSQMEGNDGAHNQEHVYRVLAAALDIAEHETGVDYDVLIAACLLHDIGRREQMEHPSLCHAAVGAEKAYAFLLEKECSEEYAEKVRACIKRHRFRSEDPPVTLEERILFDADKLDVSGAVGVARTLLYAGQVGKPLYFVREDGGISDGKGDQIDSFFREYQRKLKGIDAALYTERGRQIARERRHAAEAFYRAMLEELAQSREQMHERLERHIKKG